MRRGFGLLELVVSMALLAVALLLVAQLLKQSQVVFLNTTRGAVDPVPGFAVTLLRRDIRQARTVDFAGPDWTGSDLTLQPAAPGITVERVVYRWSSDRLERLDPGRVEPRTLLTGVSVWRWREVSPGLLEFEVRYQVSAQPLARVLGRPMQMGGDGGSSRKVRMRLALRSPGGGKW